MENRFKTIVVLSPHTDDAEFGCGATLSKLSKSDSDIYYFAFSSASESVPKNFPNTILKEEVMEATKNLGIKNDKIKLFDFPVRKFGDYRQEILEELVNIRNTINPDIVFVPSLNDCHQDHYVISREAVRAFKYTSILGYEIIWNNFHFDNHCYICISEEDLNNKVDAIFSYNSQKHRHYLCKDLIMGLARTRGAQISVRYAELFEVIRWVIS